MNKRAEARRMALEALQTPPPASLFSEPVEYVLADHFRQRTLCGFLVEIADAPGLDAELVDAALNFLKSDFGPHVRDEEEDLFPLLRQRAEPEDEIDTVLDQLAKEHAAGDANASQVVALLEGLKASDYHQPIDEDSASLLKRFATHERHHLVVETAIVLPLARVRLTKADCIKLGQRMAARRGVVLDD